MWYQPIKFEDIVEMAVKTGMKKHGLPPKVKTFLDSQVRIATRLLAFSCAYKLHYSVSIFIRRKRWGEGSVGNSIRQVVLGPIIFEHKYSQGGT